MNNLTTSKVMIQRVSNEISHNDKEETMEINW